MKELRILSVLVSITCIAAPVYAAEEGYGPFNLDGGHITCKSPSGDEIKKFQTYSGTSDRFFKEGSIKVVKISGNAPKENKCELRDIRRQPIKISTDRVSQLWKRRVFPGLALPLVSKNQVIGVLALEKWQAYAFTREHVQVGTTFASQAAVALENARLFEDSSSRAAELDERSQRLALLNRFSLALSGLLEEDKILELTARELQDALNAPRISVVGFERGKPVWKHSTPKSKTKLPSKLPDAPIFQRLQESLGVFVTDAVNAEPDLAPLISFLGDGIQSLLILPFTSGSNLR